MTRPEGLCDLPSRYDGLAIRNSFPAQKNRMDAISGFVVFSVSPRRWPEVQRRAAPDGLAAPPRTRRPRNQYGIWSKVFFFKEKLYSITTDARYTTRTQ